MNLKKLFNPKSIAVVGASAEEGKVGNVIARNILKLGYEGRVYLVNPKGEKILGKKCYESLFEIEDPIDLAVIAIPAKFVAPEIKKNADKVKNYVVISAGFSETTGEGKLREKQLKKLALEKKLNILGPNCLGFIVPRLGLNVSFAAGMPETGNISFISQSGALAVALLDIARKESVKFSNIISIGNKMQIGETELLEFMADDKSTKVIGMYLEGITEGEKFMAAAEKVSRKKPIIILKAGKNAKTQKAISSHTGALAGDDDVMSAIFRKTGILRANNLEEFFNLFNLINSSSAPQNKNTVVITNAGGVGVLTADAFNGKNINLADLSLETKNKLRKFLPEESSVENPIDLLGDAKEDRYSKALEVISGAGEIGSVICVLTPQDQTPVEKIADEIIKFKKNTDKVIAAVFLGGDRVEKAVKKMKKNEVCNFSFPDGAVSSLDGYWRWSEFQKMKIKNQEQIINGRRREKALEIINRAKKEGRTALYFSESAQILEMYGVRAVDYFEINPSENSKGSVSLPFPYPVAVKVDSDQVLHKTEKKGLILNIENKEEFQKAVEKMRNNFPKSFLVAQPMAKRTTELIIGIKRDNIFGPVIIYGLGGIYAEFLHWVDYLVPPLNISQIEDSLFRGKLGFLFEGARAQKAYSAQELARILYGIILMSREIPEIKEFDINPLLIYNNNEKAKAVDVKIII